MLRHSAGGSGHSCSWGAENCRSQWACRAPQARREDPGRQATQQGTGSSNKWWPRQVVPPGSTVLQALQDKHAAPSSEPSSRKLDSLAREAREARQA